MTIASASGTSEDVLSTRVVRRRSLPAATEKVAGGAKRPGTRLPFLDFLKGISALLIVAHHLAFYGPLSDVAYPLLPATLDWLYEYARMAVQVFLVIGGFGTARRLARLPRLGVLEFGAELGARYRRVGLPYLAALLLAIGGNELSRSWMEHPSISGPPSLAQLFAHATFLTHLLGFEPLTAGVWYLAIDFQLLATSLLLLAISQRLADSSILLSRAGSTKIFMVLSSILALGSLLWLSRLSRLENWAIYFFATYFLGILMEWALARRVPRSLVAGYFALVMLSLAHEFRPRLLVAAATTLLVLWAAKGGWLNRWPRSRVALGLGKISYSLFLVHFPVCLVVNAVGSRYLCGSPRTALFGMVLAFALSILTAIAFHRWVEAKCLQGSRAAATA